MREAPRGTRLPLLRKELTELAARRRTYAVRAVYAALLFAVFLAYAYQRLGASEFAVAHLGMGRWMFHTLLSLQLAGVFVFLPAMMAGSLAGEHERQTMPLLLLTDLSPMEIVVQKYLGHLVPMLTFFTLSLPVMAVCYAYGGLSVRHVAYAAGTLLITALQVGAVATMCSAKCRTTAGAAVLSYVVVFLYGLLLGCFGMIAALFGEGPGAAVAYGVPALLLVPAFLGSAARHATPRDLAVPGHASLEATSPAFRSLVRLNRAIERRLRRARSSLPDDQPVAWRERTRHGVGKLHYVLALVLIGGTGLLLFALADPQHGLAYPPGTLSGLLGFLWAAAGVGVAATSTDAITSERASQSLDVLLTTPLSGRDILRQKLAGVRRLIVLLLVPFLTIILLETCWRDVAAGRPGSYLLSSVFAVAVYLPLAAWFSVWLGLHVRSRSRALLTVLVALAAWVLGPWLLWQLLEPLRWARMTELDDLVLLLSPATMVVATEDPRFGANPDVVRALAHYAFYGLVLLGVRGLTLRRADRYLGRARPSGSQPRPRPEGASP